jgi:hypothetical protein
LICFSYRIVYAIRDGDCFVVAVVHGSRDLLKLIERRDFKAAEN